MNKTQLHELLSAPEKIGASETRVLAELRQQYPWCQPLHMLETKGLHNEKSISYLEKLKLTSVLTFDRKVLYTFIMQQALKEKIEALEKEVEEEIGEIVPEEKAILYVVKDSIAENTEEEKKENPEEKNQTTVVPGEKITSQKPSDPFEEIIEESKHEEPVVLITKDVLEDLIGKKIKEAIDLPKRESETEKQTEKDSTEIISEKENTDTVAVLPPENDVQQELESELPEKEKISDKYSELEKEFLWQAVNATIQVDVMNDLEKLPELDVENPIPNPEISGRKTNTTPVFSFQEEKKEKEDFNWDRPHSFINWLLPKNEDVHVDNPENPVSEESVEDLVDRFLKSDPKITPQKAEFYSPGNVAKLSIADNEEFVSETLAGIYEKQGYFAKAIRVYEKLSLKIPGKSTYFASRIKELEALKNNKNK